MVRVTIGLQEIETDDEIYMHTGSITEYKLCLIFSTYKKRVLNSLEETTKLNNLFRRITCIVCIVLLILILNK